MQVGTIKDQGLYSKPSAAVHRGALAAGTLPQYNTISIFITEAECVYCAVRTVPLNLIDTDSSLKG